MLCYVPAVDVHLDTGLGVDGEPLVRVDGHAEKTRVRLDTGREKRRQKMNFQIIQEINSIILILYHIVGNCSGEMQYESCSGGAQYSAKFQ